MLTGRIISTVVARTSRMPLRRTFASVSQSTTPKQPKIVNPIPAEPASANAGTTTQRPHVEAPSSDQPESILQRMHRSLPRPNPAEGEKFTTLSGGGWKEKGTWSDKRRRAMMIMTFTWPIMLLTGLILKKRYFGTAEERAQWIEYERMMARSAGLNVPDTPTKTKTPTTTPAAAIASPPQQPTKAVNAAR